MSGILRPLGVRIRRGDTPVCRFLYKIGKSVLQFQIPVWRPFHSLLYAEWCMRRSLWHNFWRVLYYEPMFKSQCKTVGKNFVMEYAGNGSTRIFGDLQVSFGNNVQIFDNTQFVGLKIFDKPGLIVGDNTYLGPYVRFMVARRIIIGSHCLITSRIVTDNPGHSTDDVMSRMQSAGGVPEENSIKPISIGDFVFLPLDTVVYPGVTIGDGVVARIGTHLNRDVPPFCLVSGNPMRIVRKLPIPEELEAVVGAERYNAYLESHKRIEL